MTLLQIVILAIIQGLAELLPVSSSAHVIAAAKLMHLHPESPEFTFLIVMLHTGTMFAVIVYFWRAWKRAFFSSRSGSPHFATRIVVATIVTLGVGFVLKTGIEHLMQHQHPGIKKAEIEDLFKNMQLLAGALAAAGVLILLSGFLSTRRSGRDRISAEDSVWIGAIQGLCIPFRGFSRSGATISLGLLRGVARARLEEYSFALAVVLTPFAVGWEARRLVLHNGQEPHAHLNVQIFAPSLLGMVFSFIAGLIALRLLSRLLEKGQWWLFGVYCLAASGAVLWLQHAGYFG